MNLQEGFRRVGIAATWVYGVLAVIVSVYAFWVGFQLPREHYTVTSDDGIVYDVAGYTLKAAQAAAQPPPSAAEAAQTYSDTPTYRVTDEPTHFSLQGGVAGAAPWVLGLTAAYAAFWFLARGLGWIVGGFSARN